MNTERKILPLCLIVAGLIWMFSEPVNAITTKQLADSLTVYTGFSTKYTPRVRVRNLQTKGNHIDVYTNATLSCLSLTHETLDSLRKQVAMWVLGTNDADVHVYTDNYELEELLTERVIGHHAKEGRLRMRTGAHDLTGRNIALWPSHGIYYNRKEDRWRWQRATLWTMVEDLHSVAYASLVTEMLRNAGATVWQPRGEIGDSAAMTIGPSGYPRWAEGARYWLEYTGVPDSIWYHTYRKCAKDIDSTLQTNDYLDDLRCRARWVNWLSGGSRQNPDKNGCGIPIDACIALHTDGSMEDNDTTTLGTLAIYTDYDGADNKVLANGVSRLANRDLADRVQTQVVEDIRKSFCPNWCRRQLWNADYNESRMPVVPSMILEILSHQNFADIHYGLDPRFRFVVARAVYKGIGRWLQGDNFVAQPLAVHALRTNIDGRHLIIEWQPSIDTLEPTAVPDKYIVQRLSNDGEWTMAGETTHTSFSMPLIPAEPYQLRVIAVNAGGQSMPSNVTCAYKAPAPNLINDKPVLIVNAFNEVRGPRWFADRDRGGICNNSYSIPDGIDYTFIGEQHEYRRDKQWVSDDDCGWGMSYRDYATKPVVGNTHDYQCMHARALREMNMSYVTCEAESFPEHTSDYKLIDIIDGKQSVPATFALDNAIPVLRSGIGLGDIADACASGLLIADNRQLLSYPMRPDSIYLHAESVTGFTLKPDLKAVARYTDSALPAAVISGNRLRWGVPLESMRQFMSIYEWCVKLLLDK